MFMCISVKTLRLIALGSSPEVANFSLKNDCFSNVVLCCFCVIVVALPFSASLERIVHVIVHIVHAIMCSLSSFTL